MIPGGDEDCLADSLGCMMCRFAAPISSSRILRILKLTVEVQAAQALNVDDRSAELISVGVARAGDQWR